MGRTVHLEWFDRPGPRAGHRDARPADRGLRFECTQCGACCTGAPGYVRFTDEEADAMAAKLGLDRAAFVERFTHDTPAGRSLRERKTRFGYDCVFLDRDAVPGKAVCGLYDARPMQCRTWPFWKSNLSGERAWQGASKGCPGIDRGERATDPAAIRAQRDAVPM
ncbi:MAG: YkgJ family cysteine cluster protein [Planctomycetota bacterium]